ncbi:MAG: sugar ABC transporter permease, partial [Chitinivibrionales bacterium]|nr:sugar ABC transporter permease [Chitinivibrionales bacterium]
MKTEKNGNVPGEIITPWVLLAPVVFVVVLFILVPVLGSFHNSLFRDVTYLPKEFIGMDNFVRLFYNKDFHHALTFTLLFTCAAVALEAFFGLLFALLLNETFKGRGFLRTIILIPWAIPTIVSAKVWQLI